MVQHRWAKHADAVCQVAGSFESERQASEVAMRALRDELSKGLSESANALVSTKQGLDKDLAAAKSEHAKALEAGLCKRESK